MRKYLVECILGLFFATAIVAAASGYSIEVPFIYQGF